MFLASISFKNGGTPSKLNITRLYVIDDVMKIKMAAKWHHAGLCSDLSTN